MRDPPKRRHRCLIGAQGEWLFGKYVKGCVGVAGEMGKHEKTFSQSRAFSYAEIEQATKEKKEVQGHQSTDHVGPSDVDPGTDRTLAIRRPTPSGGCGSTATGHTT